MQLINFEEKNKWEKIVKSFEEYDIYYLPNYLEAFRLHGDGEPLLFYYDGDSFRAINVVMIRDIYEVESLKKHLLPAQKFDLTTPYGYGGFLFEGNVKQSELELMFSKYDEICKKNNYVSEFVRFHPLLTNPVLLRGYYEVEKIGSTVVIDLINKEYLWDNFTGKNRNVIRKAIKNDVHIYKGLDQRLINEFIEMYEETMDKESANNYYYFNRDFYQSILTDLKNNCLIFYAEYGGETIAMALILFANDKMHYHLSASKREYLNLAPTNYLLKEAAEWGIDNGYKTLHLGGGLGAKEDSLYKFKKSFTKKDALNYYIGKKTFDNAEYENLVMLKEDEIPIDFFPKYRSNIG